MNQAIGLIEICTPTITSRTRSRRATRQLRAREPIGKPWKMKTVVGTWEGTRFSPTAPRLSIWLSGLPYHRRGATSRWNRVLDGLGLAQGVTKNRPLRVTFAYAAQEVKA